MLICISVKCQQNISNGYVDSPCQYKEMVAKYGVHDSIHYNNVDSLLYYFYKSNKCDSFFYWGMDMPGTFELNVYKSIGNYTFIYVYRCSGEIKSITSYIQNKKNGMEMHYRYNGIIFSAPNYVNDTLATPFIYQYDEVGRVESCKYKTNLPEPDSLVIYDTNGIIVQSEKYIYGLGGVSNQYFFYPNGQIYISNLCAQHGKPGIYTKYYEDGTLMEKGAKYGNAREGEWLFYFPNGEIKMKVMFGIPINYQEVKDGPTEYFYDDGQHLKTEIYKKGILKKTIWNPRYGPQSK